ncbi:MAG: hypothetical protein ABUK01_06780 [Leptospirales bacterium]
MFKKSKIKRNKEIILVAIQDYVRLSEELLSELLQHLKLSWPDVHKDLRMNLPNNMLEGELESGWAYWFHGSQCKFIGIYNEQVEVNLDKFGDIDHLLDPYYLAKYIKTSNLHKGMAMLIKDDFKDTLEILETLDSTIKADIKFSRPLPFL